MAATRAALPPNGTDYVKYSNSALSHRSLALNAGTYLGWLFSVIGQQTGNIDIQVGSHNHWPGGDLLISISSETDWHMIEHKTRGSAGGFISTSGVDYVS